MRHLNPRNTTGMTPDDIRPRTPSQALEFLIDNGDEGLAGVVKTLADVCLCKALCCRDGWGDNRSARTWFRAERSIRALAPWLHRLGL